MQHEIITMFLKIQGQAGMDVSTNGSNNPQLPHPEFSVLLLYPACVSGFRKVSGNCGMIVTNLGFPQLGKLAVPSFGAQQKQA